MDTPKYRIAFGAVSLLIGILFNFYGRKFFKYVIFLIGFLVYGQIIGQIIVLVVFKDSFWGYVGGCLIGGILGGGFALCCFKCHTFCIGFAAGGTLAGMIAVLVLFYVDQLVAQLVVLAFALIVGFGSYCFTDVIIMYITSFQGASLIISGILMIANRAVNVTQIDGVFHWEAIVYVVVTVLLTGIGYFKQKSDMTQEIMEKKFISYQAYKEESNLWRANKEQLLDRHNAYGYDESQYWQVRPNQGYKPL